MLRSIPRNNLQEQDGSIPRAEILTRAFTDSFQSDWGRLIPFKERVETARWLGSSNESETESDVVVLCVT
jgi:hypothetical protein